MNYRHSDQLRVDNSTGFKGVCYRENVDMYEAYIYHKSKKIYLGVFKTLHEAIKTREKAEFEIWQNKDTIN